MASSRTVTLILTLIGVVTFQLIVIGFTIRKFSYHSSNKDHIDADPNLAHVTDHSVHPVVKLACYHQCCFEYRTHNSVLPTNYEVDNPYSMLMFWGSLPLTVSGPLAMDRQPNCKKYSIEPGTLLAELSRLNDVRKAGLVVSECFWEETDDVVRFVERRVLGRTRSDLCVLRIDRVFQDVVDSKVEYSLIGVTPGVGTDLRFLRATVERTQDDIDGFRGGSQLRITSTETYGASTEPSRSLQPLPVRVNIGVCVFNMPSVLLLSFLENIHEVIRFDRNHFGGRSRLIIADHSTTALKRNINIHLFEDNTEIVLIASPKTEMNRKACYQDVIDVIEDIEIVFIVDVDMVIPADFLHRVRSFVKPGVQFFAPVCYSQKANVSGLDNDDKHLGRLKDDLWHPLVANVQYDEKSYEGEMGYWRKWGFGMIAGYKQDLDVVNGFRDENGSTEQVVWGLEDVDLVKKLLKNNYRVFHSAEMSYFHQYHLKREWTARKAEK